MIYLMRACARAGEKPMFECACVRACACARGECFVAVYTSVSTRSARCLSRPSFSVPPAIESAYKSHTRRLVSGYTGATEWGYRTPMGL